MPRPSKIEVGVLSDSVSSHIISDLVESIDTVLDDLSVLQHSSELSVEFLDVLSFRTKYLKHEMLSKFVGKGTDSSELRRSRAIEKWLCTEQRNVRTNFRLNFDETSFHGISSDLILGFARKVIADTIGLEPPRLLQGSFSGGASTSVKRGPGAYYQKFMDRLDVTEMGLPWILPSIMENSGWTQLNGSLKQPKIVRGNVLFTVPKTSTIDRVAAKEPDLNMWMQKAIGDYLRRKLQKAGINLNDQTVNQRLALQGSKDGSLATFDLSSASDSLSLSLVTCLLPPGWFVLMNAVRSQYTCIDGEWHENAMFSSMGNGFTFELESLIFWALARACAYFYRTPGRISVYGDDIIVPSALGKVLPNVFGFCGFLINKKKSFHTGHFRESCGAHYYAGYCVKPFYIRKPLRCVSDLVRILNRLRAWLDSNDLTFDFYREYNLDGLHRFWLRWSAIVDRRLHGGRSYFDDRFLVSPGKFPRWTLAVVTRRLDQLVTKLAPGGYLASLALQPLPVEEFRPDTTLAGLTKFADAVVDRAEFSVTREVKVVLRRYKPCSFDWAQPPHSWGSCERTPA